MFPEEQIHNVVIEGIHSRPAFMVATGMLHFNHDFENLIKHRKTKFFAGVSKPEKVIKEVYYLTEFPYAVT